MHQREAVSDFHFFQKQLPLTLTLRRMGRHFQILFNRLHGLCRSIESRILYPTEFCFNKKVQLIVASYCCMHYIPFRREKK